MRNLSNRVNLIGNLGMDPEVKSLNGGKKVARMSLATSQSYRNQEGEIIKDTQWHNLVAWDKLASVSERFLKKGQEIAVEGRIIYRQYDSKEGQKKNITEIVVNEILLLQNKKQ